MLSPTSTPELIQSVNSSDAPDNRSYAALKKLIVEKGLLDKQPGFLTYKIILTATMWIVGIVVLFLTDNMWIQLLNAVYLAFVFGQFGFIAHDTGHRQGFHTTKQNDFFGLLHANLLIGMSYGWWMDKHNKHHAHPNQEDMDPDIDIPVIAFSEKAMRSGAWTRRRLGPWKHGSSPERRRPGGPA